MRRILALVLAYFFLALAMIGLFLPGLPTVPFLILTAWFAARGSERLHQWLYDHPHLGRLLIDWEQSGSIARRYKVMAVGMLMVSWTVMYFQVESAWALFGATLLFFTVSVFIVTRPESQ